MSLSLERRVDEKDSDIELELENRIRKTIVTEPNLTLDDVCGLQKEKLMLMAPVLSTKRCLNRFLLFGPRGTGKTYLAKAIAGQAASLKWGGKPFTFFSVSSSDLRSKWYGETERLIKNLFALVKRESPSIIFLDDLDMLFDVYTDDEWMRRVKRAFRLQLDLMKNYKEKVIFISATSVLDNLDNSLWRKFDKLIYIPVPDKDLRGEMFSKHLSKTAISREDILRFAQITGGFSSNQIAIACQLARDKEDVFERIQAMVRTSYAEVKEFNKFAKKRVGWKDSHEFTFSDAVKYEMVGCFV